MEGLTPQKGTATDPLNFKLIKSAGFVNLKQIKWGRRQLPTAPEYIMSPDRGEKSKRKEQGYCKYSISIEFVNSQQVFLK